jgi:hypothetical protein
VFVDPLRLGGIRLSSCPCRHEDPVALERALTGSEPELGVVLPADRTPRERLADRLVGRQLASELHQIGLRHAVEFRETQVSEHDVMDFVEEDPVEELRSVGEEVEVHVQTKAPAGERHRHHGDPGIGDGIHTGEDGRIERIASQEGWSGDDTEQPILTEIEHQDALRIDRRRARRRATLGPPWLVA